MRKLQRLTGWMAAIAIVFMLFLSACSDSSSSSPKASYTMSVTNITHNQPLSPAAFVLHTEGYLAWETGAAVSLGLEMLAEAGDADLFLDEAMDSPAVLSTGVGSGIIGPGGSDAVEFETTSSTDLRVSFAAMLVNTNDAFTGRADASLSDLSINESRTFFIGAYDAGTEVNSETAGSIPGPAAGGEGHNPARDDTGFISVHAGVLTAEDGLDVSVLDESHRWQNPVARLTVTRTK